MTDQEWPDFDAGDLKLTAEILAEATKRGVSPGYLHRTMYDTPVFTIREPKWERGEDPEATAVLIDQGVQAWQEFVVRRAAAHVGPYPEADWSGGTGRQMHESASKKIDPKQ